MLFGNILALLNHIYAMDVAWKCNLLGVPHKMKTRNPDKVPSFNDLRKQQVEINEWYKIYVKALSVYEMSQEIQFTFIGGSEGKMRISDVLQHVVNHATYHRGHIEGVLYQLQIEPPTTDIPVFLKTEEA